MSTGGDQPHLLLLAAHLGPSGHTGGFRWHGLLDGLATRGWTADVVTSTPADLAAPPDGVTVHTVGDDWVGSRARLWLADRRDSARNRQDRDRTDGNGARDGRPDERGQPDDASPVPDHDAPWPGRRRPLGDAGLADQLRRDLVDASRLLTEAVWARRVTATALGLPRMPDVVVSTSPAELLLVVGRLVARRRGAPHVPDFRDLWVLARPDWALRTRPLTWLGRMLEPRVVDDAPVTVDIASTAAEARAQHTTTPSAFIPSGWVPLGKPPTEPDPTTFRVVYSGWLYPDMDLRPLFAGCAELLRRRPSVRDRLRLAFLGSPTHVAGVALADLASSAGLGPDVLEITQRLPREEAAEREATAAVLVCPGFTDGLHTPSKLYGYARLRGQLLVLGQPDDALAREVAQLGIRSVRAREEIAKQLVAAHDRWRAGGPWPVTDADGVLACDRSAAAWDGLLRGVVAGADGAELAIDHGPVLPPVDEQLGGRRDHVDAVVDRASVEPVRLVDARVPGVGDRP